MLLLAGAAALLLALLSTPTANAAATFKVNLYQGTENCNAVGLVDVVEGPFVSDAVACFAYGGNSFWVVDSGGCKVQSWSGKDCKGSSSTLIDNTFCQAVTFGSILVVC